MIVQNSELRGLRGVENINTLEGIVKSLSDIECVYGVVKLYNPEITKQIVFNIYKNSDGVRSEKQGFVNICFLVCSFLMTSASSDLFNRKANEQYKHLDYSLIATAYTLLYNDKVVPSLTEYRPRIEQCLKDWYTGRRTTLDLAVLYCDLREVLSEVEYAEALLRMIVYRESSFNNYCLFLRAENLEKYCDALNALYRKGKLYPLVNMFKNEHDYYIAKTLRCEIDLEEDC